MKPDAKLADLFTRRLAAVSQVRKAMPMMQLSEQDRERLSERLDWAENLCTLGRNAASSGCGAIALADVPEWLADDATFGTILATWQTHHGLMTRGELHEVIADRIIADAGGNFELAHYAIDYCKGDVSIARATMRRNTGCAGPLMLRAPQPRSKPMHTDTDGHTFTDESDEARDAGASVTHTGTLTAGEAMAARGLRTSMQARGASPTAIDAAVSRMLANMRAKPQAAA